MKNPKKSAKKSSKKIIKNSPSPDVLHIPVPVKPSTYVSLNQEEINSKQNLDYETYKLTKDEFKLSRKAGTMLRRSAIYSEISTENRHIPLLICLTKTAEEMMMNELEIAVWNIYLKRFVWNEINQTFEVMLYITALAVKSYLNLSVNPFKAHLATKFPNFSNIYNCWVRNRKNSLSIFPCELNKIYKSLSKPVITNDDLKLIDYNFYVDDILEFAPAMPHRPRNSKPSKEKAPEFIQETPENIVINMNPYKEIEPKGILLGKKDSIFCSNSYCDTPTLATSWSYMSTGSKSGQETACFDNSDSDIKNQANKNDIYGELPTFNHQQSLFSSYWNGKTHENEKNDEEETPLFTSQKSLFSSFWNTQPTK